MGYSRLYLKKDESGAVDAEEQTSTSGTYTAIKQMTSSLSIEPSDKVSKNIPVPNNGPRYLRRERKAPIRFTINALCHICSDTKSATGDSMKGVEGDEWKAAINTEVKTLDDMKCESVLPRWE